MLILKDWHVIITHGNLYQHGLPDLYAMHRAYGTRWIETKNPGKFSFTKAQLESFPMFTAKGVGIWIVTAATEDEYMKLFRPANWHLFLPIWNTGYSGR